MKPEGSGIESFDSHPQRSLLFATAAQRPAKQHRAKPSLVSLDGFGIIPRGIHPQSSKITQCNAVRGPA